MHIRNVIVTKQKDHEIYTFSMSANDLISISKVERFGLDTNGVNRQLNQGHVLNIATAMSSKSDERLWLDAIIVDLVGDWKFEDGQLLGDKGSYMSIDDGQHRVHALQSGLLTETEVSDLNFTVTATRGLPYETRLRIFRMQGLRRQIDSRLDLAQRYRLNEWESDLDREAYQLVLELNVDPSSPLRGRIILDEKAKRPYENGADVGGINARGLFLTVRSIIARRSPLHTLLPAKRNEIIKETIRIASDVWRNQWDSDRHILTTARGINALLLLYVSGVNFRGQVGTDFTSDTVRRGLMLGSSFDWSASKARNHSVKQILERLDQSILRSLQNQNRKQSNEAGGHVTQ